MVTTILQVALGVFRVGGLLVAMPVFGVGPFPPETKFLFAMALAVMLLPFVPRFDPALWNDGGFVMVCVAREVGIGLLIGFGARLLFLMVSMAMEYSGMQVGFSIASLIDPQNNAHVSVLAQFAVVISVLTFFGANLHHELFRALVASYQFFPPGVPSWEGAGLAQQLIHLMSQAFSLALRLTLPIMIVMLIINLLMGIISRTAPQMNLFFNVAFAVNLVSGLLLIMMTMPWIVHTLGRFADALARHGYGLW